MNAFLVRMIVALLLAALLWAQARAARDRPHRRRAFELAAAALLAFAALNGSLAAGAEPGPLQLVIAAAGLALFVGSVVSTLQALRSGEMREQGERVAAAAREYRERRSDRRPATTDDRPPTDDGDR